MHPSVEHDAYAAFRTPGFGRLLCGSVLNHVGAAAQSVAIGWELYVRTDSALALGLVGLTQAIPMLLLTLPAGYLADIFDRRKLIVCGLSGAILTSIGLAVLSYQRGSIPIMYALLFLDAAFHRIGGPAGSALLPLLVPRTALENAITWKTSTFHIASVLGPAIGGIIVAFHLPAAYLFSACASSAFVVLLCTLKIPDGARSQPGRMLQQVAEGLRFVWHQKVILGTISLDLFAVLLGGAVYLLPIFARDILTTRPFGLSPEQALGFLRAAPALGAFLMALVLAHRPPMQHAGRAMLGGVACFGLATIVFGLSRNFWLSFGMLFLTGLFDNIGVVVRHTLVQMRTPNEMRGRVSAVNAIFIGSSNELGGFESGLVAQFFGPVISVVSGGVGTILVVAGWARLFPGLRSFGRLSDPDEESVASKADDAKT